MKKEYYLTKSMIPDAQTIRIAERKSGLLSYLNMGELPLSWHSIPFMTVTVWMVFWMYPPAIDVLVWVLSVFLVVVGLVVGIFLATHDTFVDGLKGVINDAGKDTESIHVDDENSGAVTYGRLACKNVNVRSSSYIETSQSTVEFIGLMVTGYFIPEYATAIWVLGIIMIIVSILCSKIIRNSVKVCDTLKLMWE